MINKNNEFCITFYAIFYHFLCTFFVTFRLISEKTIEENILKKANEKRLLGNVAIEGGNFTTAFFKQVDTFVSS